MTRKARGSKPVKNRKRPEYAAGDTFVDGVGRLLRILSIIDAKLSTDPRFYYCKDKLLVIEVVDTGLKLVPSKVFDPQGWGWRPVKGFGRIHPEEGVFNYIH